MQIVCPACEAAYEVPPSLLKPGQTVRCARCAREWVCPPAAPEAPVAATVDAAADPEPAAAPPEPEGVRPAPPPSPPPEPKVVRPASPPPPEPKVVRPAPPPPMARFPTPRPNVVLRLAWVASVVAVLLLGWAAYAERSAIMQAWPPSIRLYAAMGMAAGR